MRTSILLGLAVGAVILFGTTSVSVRHARNRPGIPPKPTKPEALSLVAEVEGYGLTEEAARKVALERAQDKVVAFLAQARPEPKWTPSADYLWKEGLVRPKGPAELVKTPVSNEELERVRLEVQVTPEQLRKMTDLDRRAGAGKRYVLLAKVLAGMLALLAVLSGYLRLEEATRGYYTNLLRLVAVALVTLAGVGLWWVR